MELPDVFSQSHYKDPAKDPSLPPDQKESHFEACDDSTPMHIYPMLPMGQSSTRIRSM